jgi:hypothetical protein
MDYGLWALLIIGLSTVAVLYYAVEKLSEA